MKSKNKSLKLSRRGFIHASACTVAGAISGTLVGRLGPLFSFLPSMKRADLHWDRARACTGDGVRLEGRLLGLPHRDPLVIRIRPASNPEIVLAEHGLDGPDLDGPSFRLSVPRPRPKGRLAPGLHPLVATVERKSNGQVLAKTGAPLEVLVQPMLFGL